MERKIFIVLLHISFWAYYVAIKYQEMMSRLIAKSNGGTVYSNDLNWDWPFFMNNAIPSFITFYFFYFILFSYFKKTKKKWIMIAMGVLFLVVVAFIKYLFSEVRINVVGSVFSETLFLSLLLITNVLSLLIYAASGFAIQGVIHWFKDQKIKEALIRKNHQMELALVKAQLDPHFLFNTLNNIDILIKKSQDKASLYLNQLSDIMRFMLFETKSETIPLTQEIEYIEKYIALQKIRSINPNFVHFEVSGTTEETSIAPMLFIPFIENAFKHVEDKEIDRAIQIKLSILPKSIVFECSNQFGQLIEMDAKYNGLGNQLIEKRLNLLYPNSYELSIHKKESSYMVNLTLQKDEN